MIVRHRKLILTTLAITLWLALLLAALLWYQNRYIRPFDERVASFDGQSLQLPAAIAHSGRIRLVHIWDPACPCNRGNQAHLAQLIEHYGPQGVDFFSLQKPNSYGQLPAALQSLKILEQLPGAEHIAASPAVAIWNAQDQLVYFGPYSAGFTCDASNSFIEPILQAALAGRTPSSTNTLAVGCFCNWQTEQVP